MSSMSHSSETLNQGDHGNPRLYSQLVRRAGGLGTPPGVWLLSEVRTVIFGTGPALTPVAFAANSRWSPSELHLWVPVGVRTDSNFYPIPQRLTKTLLSFSAPQIPFLDSSDTHWGKVMPNSQLNTLGFVFLNFDPLCFHCLV